MSWLKNFRLLIYLAALAFTWTGCQTADRQPRANARTPKKILVVTTTTGFRHSSIETAEKVLANLAQESGIFTVEFAQTGPPPAKPKKPEAPKEGGDRTKFDADMEKFKAQESQWQEAERRWKEKIPQVLQKLSSENLKNYHGVIFANTTGDLPLPDKQAFLDWIKSGKAFLGMHSATDTFRGHKPLDAYVEMLGAEFKTHGAQVEVEVLNQDPLHPACRHYPSSFKIKDEIYIFNGFNRSTVHGLLTLDKHPNDKTPGDYPIAWCKDYGKGKVFYTSLGHREDVWESPEYQKHILGAIKWALGLEPGDARPQTR